MGWVAALVSLAVLVDLICVGIVVFCMMRDRGLRGTRISNQEIQRERITISIPFMHHDYKDQT